MREGYPRRFFDFCLGGVRLSVANIVAHGVVEEHGLLRDQRNLPAEAGYLCVSKIHAVPENAAGNGIMKARQELRERRLSTAGFTNQRYHRTSRNLQTYFAQHRTLFIRIPKGDVFQLNRAQQRSEFTRVFLFYQLGMLVHYFPNVVRRRQRLLHAVLESRELPHGVVTAKEKKQKGNKLRRVHAAGNNFTLAKE